MRTILLISFLVFAGCVTASAPADLNEGYSNTELPTEERVALIMADMSLQAKALQMVQIEREMMYEYYSFTGFGSIISGGGSTPQKNTVEGWEKLLDKVQKGIRRGEFQIPAMYGIDAIHGHTNVSGTTIFPHNIGLGAANDSELMEDYGRIVANEMFKTRILWNFSPCVALAHDPRWGRSYESFSTDPELTASLGTAFVKGFQDAGGVATAKHYLGEGQTTWGTSVRYDIDQGDTQLSLEEIRETALIPYRALVESGVKTVMVSFSSVNGEKIHGNHYLLTEVLKEELGFEGFIVSDWEAIQQLPVDSFDQQSPAESYDDETFLKIYYQQIVQAVNAGCDMLMEPYYGGYAWRQIVAAVENGDIEMSRVDDAVRRILTVKIEAGLFEDPMLEKLAVTAPPLRDPNSLEVARQLVEKSLVLLKNENEVLPLKKNQTILLLGPATDDIGLQCGGWTITWQGQEDIKEKITEGTTLKESLEALSTEIGFTLLTDPGRAEEADLILLALAEMPYAEGEGDDPAPSITGAHAHKENAEAIALADKSGLPTVTVLMAGRHISIEEYWGEWDAVVMAYLPGTEGQGMGRVLTGQVPFSGTLPMPWYKNVEGKTTDEFEVLLKRGYGLKY